MLANYKTKRQAISKMGVSLVIADGPVCLSQEVCVGIYGFYNMLTLSPDRIKAMRSEYVAH